MKWENWLTGNLQAFKQPCKCWKKAQQRCEKTNFERLQGDEMPQNSQEWLSAFSENESLKSKSKDYCQLENCLFSHQRLSKKVEDKFLSLLREKDLNEVDAHEKKGFQHTLWTPFMWQCDFETSTLRKSLLSRTWHKSVCNNGTRAMMAVTVLPSKMSASSRRLNSILDTARLKHTISLTNPRLLMVRILEMVPAVPHGNFTSTKAFKMQKIQLKTPVLASWHFARTAHQRILKHLQKLQCAKIIIHVA